MPTYFFTWWNTIFATFITFLDLIKFAIGILLFIKTLLVKESNTTGHLLVSFFGWVVALWMVMMTMLLSLSLLEDSLHFHIAFFSWIYGSLCFNLIIIFIISLNSFLNFLIGSLHLLLIFLVVFVAFFGVAIWKQVVAMWWRTMMWAILPWIMTMLLVIFVSWSILFLILMGIIIINWWLCGMWLFFGIIFIIIYLLIIWILVHWISALCWFVIFILFIRI